jgi:phage-related minor tail protein
MCMSCGCGDWNERHKEGDITLDDMRRAAQNANIDVEQVADNIHEAARQVRAQSGS